MLVARLLNTGKQACGGNWSLMFEFIKMQDTIKQIATSADCWGKITVLWGSYF